MLDQPSKAAPCNCRYALALRVSATPAGRPTVSVTNDCELRLSRVTTRLPHANLACAAGARRDAPCAEMPHAPRRPRTSLDPGRRGRQIPATSHLPVPTCGRGPGGAQLLDPAGGLG